MNEHTPTPWKANKITEGWIQDDTDALVASAMCQRLHGKAKGITAAQMVANAEFIVRACNAYDSNQKKIETLVTACENYVRANGIYFEGLKSVGALSVLGEENHDLLAKWVVEAKAALTTAKGE